MQQIKASIADIPVRQCDCPPDAHGEHCTFHPYQIAGPGPTPISKPARRRRLLALGGCLATVVHAGHSLKRIARETCILERTLQQLQNIGRGVSDAQEADLRAWLDKNAPDVLRAIAALEVPAGEEG